jgi:hypothetical protein
MGFPQALTRIQIREPSLRTGEMCQGVRAGDGEPDIPGPNVGSERHITPDFLISRVRLAPLLVPQWQLQAYQPEL